MASEKYFEKVAFQWDQIRKDLFPDEVREVAFARADIQSGKLAADIGVNLVATGHTRDDQIETILMRILRGTGVRGLAGIPFKRGKLIGQ